MENDLMNSISSISAKLNCSSTKPAYNPMERFADYVSTKEIIHSKIIADLLNPNGEHQLGDGFIMNFLSKLNIQVYKFSSPDAKNPLTIKEIKTEYPAPTSGKNGRIDIFVRLKNREKLYALIIENKLNNAGHQPEQLQRYNEFVKQNYPTYERVTVYMPCNGTECTVFKNAIVVNATDLADIIDDTLKENNNVDNSAIQAYSKYLRNISTYNEIMDNAIKLADMSADDILNAKVIKDAYEKLPQAFANYLKKTYERTGYRAEISSKYSRYCNIWKPETYGITNLWLAVGFDYGGYFFYIVSNNMKNPKYPECLKTLNITKSSEDAEGYWHKPNDEKLFKKSFTGRPDYDKLKSDIDKWLEKLDEVAGVK